MMTTLATAFVGQPESWIVSFVCPSCGTDYSRKLARLGRLPAKVRCHRCAAVWDPAGTDAEPEPPAAEAPVVAPPSPPTLTAPRQPRGSRSGRVLWTATAVLLLLGVGAFAYGFRDLLPFASQTQPVLAEVRPVWTEVEGSLRLAVSASVVNPALVPATVDRVRVKFLSERGAWVGEATVAVPPTAVPATGTAPIMFTVERVPDGATSLELVVVPAASSAS